MRGVVVYDSYYGNTKIVAEAIAGQLRAEGHETDLRSVRDKHQSAPQGDIMFIGSPVRLGSVTRRVKKYVEKLDRGFWEGKTIVTFTTILALPPNATDEQRMNQDKYDIGAGRSLRDLVRSVGLKAVEEPLWVEVTGMKGPLIGTGVEKTKKYTHELLLSLKG